MSRERRRDPSHDVDVSSAPEPSFEDVVTRLLVTHQASVYPADNIQTVSVGPDDFIVVMEPHNAQQLRARYVNTSAIVQMLARHLDSRAAASVVAEEVLEPTNDWILVDRATATSLLHGDRHVIDHVFGADAD